eukprot:1158454-Pelagomonas_calceolata.AAC.12
MLEGKPALFSTLLCASQLVCSKKLLRSTLLCASQLLLLPCLQQAWLCSSMLAPTHFLQSYCIEQATGDGATLGIHAECQMEGVSSSSAAAAAGGDNSDGGNGGGVGQGGKKPNFEPDFWEADRDAGVAVRRSDGRSEAGEVGGISPRIDPIPPAGGGVAPFGDALHGVLCSPAACHGQGCGDRGAVTVSMHYCECLKLVCV